MGELFKRRISPTILVLGAKGSWLPCAVPGSPGKASWQLSKQCVTRTSVGWWIGPLSTLSLHLRLLLRILAVLPPSPSSCSGAHHSAACDTSWSPGSAASSIAPGREIVGTFPTSTLSMMAPRTHCAFIRQTHVECHLKPETAPSLLSWIKHNSFSA